MINTLSDLLNELRKAEAKVIDAKGITHTPTIGHQYEGLTARILNEALFTNLNLNVVRNSFILGKGGKRSPEMDVMLIEGEGALVDYTNDQFDVTPEQVIVVIQVKKHLNKKMLWDSYENLRSVSSFSESKAFPVWSRFLFQNAYRLIARQDVVEKGTWRRTFATSTHEQVFHILKEEAQMPARILFGYEGYSTENGLRSAFIDMLQEKQQDGAPTPGFNPAMFPDLVLCDNLSLLKGNGMPYSGTMQNGIWKFYFSDARNPMLKLLEVIWTRLSYRFKIDPAIFGDDMVLEGLHPFIDIHLVNVGGIRGWHFGVNDFSARQLKAVNPEVSWEPVSLTKAEFEVMTMLCQTSPLRIDKVFPIARAQGLPITEFLEKLAGTGLVAIEHRQLWLLTDQCRTLQWPGLGYFAGDDKTGQFSRWRELKQQELSTSQSAPTP